MGVCGSHREVSEKEKTAKILEKQIEKQLGLDLQRRDRYISRYTDEVQMGRRKHDADVHSMNCFDTFNEKPYHVINPNYLTQKEKLKLTGGF